MKIKSCSNGWKFDLLMGSLNLDTVELPMRLRLVIRLNVYVSKDIVNGIYFRLGLGILALTIPLHRSIYRKHHRTMLHHIIRCLVLKIK